MRIKLEFKPEDCWIGAYWKRHLATLGVWEYNLWVCLIPMLPIHITWQYDFYKPYLDQCRAEAAQEASQDTAPMESDPC